MIFNFKEKMLVGCNCNSISIGTLYFAVGDSFVILFLFCVCEASDCNQQKWVNIKYSEGGRVKGRDSVF